LFVGVRSGFGSGDSQGLLIGDGIVHVIRRRVAFSFKMLKLCCSSSPRISSSEGAEAAASGRAQDRAKANVNRMRPTNYQDTKRATAELDGAPQPSPGTD